MECLKNCNYRINPSTIYDNYMVYGKGTQPEMALTQNASCMHDLKTIILWP